MLALVQTDSEPDPPYVHVLAYSTTQECPPIGSVEESARTTRARTTPRESFRLCPPSCAASACLQTFQCTRRSTCRSEMFALRCFWEADLTFVRRAEIDAN